MNKICKLLVIRIPHLKTLEQSVSINRLTSICRVNVLKFSFGTENLAKSLKLKL